ncbi:MAG: Ni/Fe-hydrogenase, b-type cytochrome subunit [Propionibacteriaceae bacterium]|jgi:Ni/Fe-hydrogenase b-type cytochrome subunit|nr:Ni/Fe-hydrogenase, b-type cytochrome subunit [Propionibacteriaceae bacterium]
MTDQLEGKVEPGDVIAGAAYSLGSMSEGRIMALAAASPPNSVDPVDIALKQGMDRGYPQIRVPDVDADDFDPATPNRRYSLTRVRAYTRASGAVEDLVVMRGEMASILEKVKVGREHGSLLKRKSNIAIHRGWRPLAVATARVDADDKLGPFRLQGFVAVSSNADRSQIDEDILTGPATWARISVWSPSLRIQHWANVALIFILSCTGFFIMEPFFSQPAYAGAASGFLMGWVRLIHFVAAFAWIVVAAARVWSAFTSSDRYLRWRAMWPLWKTEDLKNLGRTVLHYTFIRTEGPTYLGHNPLQQLTYTGVYGLCLVQMLTGFTLFALAHPTNAFWAFLATPVHIFGVPAIRLFHTIVMFLLWGFVIGHVYLVFRADTVERHGGLSAMVNGGVWVRRGTRPVDAPVIE